MNKKEFVELHKLLAKLKFEVAIAICETNIEATIKEYQNFIKAIDKVMEIFIIDN